MKTQIKFRPRYAVIAVVAVIVIIFAASCLVTVQAGEIGYRTSLGKIVETELQPGLHFRFPITQKIVPVSVQEHVYNTITPAFTMDMQTADINVIVNWAVEPAYIKFLVENIGVDQIEAKLIVPRVNSVLKNTVGLYNASDLVASRNIVSDLVKNALSDTLIDYGIRITGFSLANIDFSDAFEQAIEQKVQAEQEALRAKNVTLQREEENTQAVNKAKADAQMVQLEADAEAYSIRVRAEAEAEAIRLIQQQLSTNPLYVEYLKALAWDGKLPTTQLSPNSNIIFDLP
ncbi:MAG: hypothetical protein LBN02_00030 [Oscillospiraceae bacterium]|jgi:regulator of protease activity HflC (stomatin/prohibitin superfamily)|nr:hypothetical protein [Oscillospiraceae bacterium]